MTLKTPINECDACGSLNVRVVRKRSYPGRNYRRLECIPCGERWTVWELRLASDLIDLCVRRGLDMQGVLSASFLDDT